MLIIVKMSEIIELSFSKGKINVIILQMPVIVWKRGKKVYSQKLDFCLSLIPHFFFLP